VRGGICKSMSGIGDECARRFVAFVNGEEDMSSPTTASAGSVSVQNVRGGPVVETEAV